MNGFGEHTVSAITAAYRVDSMLLLPIVNFSTAISTLVAQETGAENKEARKENIQARHCSNVLYVSYTYGCYCSDRKVIAVYVWIEI